MMFNHRKYVSDESLHWLLDPSDPDVRYLALRDIQGQAGDDDYARAEAHLAAMPFLQERRRGLPGDSKRFDLYYRGTLWCLAEAVSRGLDRRTASVAQSAEYLLEVAQSKTGAFSLPWRPAVESALHTGEMARLLAAAGMADERTDLAIDWIVKHQRHDGGWLHWSIGRWRDLPGFLLLNRPGSGLARERDAATASCPYATAACALALLTRNRQSITKEIAAAREKAATFLLTAGLCDFRNTGLFNSRMIVQQDFRLMGFPVLGQYDILYGLNILARAGRFSDPGAAAAFNLVMAKQNSDGTWNQESTEAGMIFGNASRTVRGKKSKWVTLNVLRMFRWAHEFSGDQFEKA
jgi:hypothetical protein